MVIVIEKGSTGECRGCPYYEPGGVVEGFGGPIKSRCRQIMEPYWFDCEKYNLHTLRLSTEDAPKRKGDRLPPLRLRKPRKKRRITSPVKKENSYVN